MGRLRFKIGMGLGHAPQKDGADFPDAPKKTKRKIGIFGF